MKLTCFQSSPINQEKKTTTQVATGRSFLLNVFLYFWFKFQIFEKKLKYQKSLKKVSTGQNFFCGPLHELLLYEIQNPKKCIFFKLCKWYQIAQRTTYIPSLDNYTKYSKF